MFIYSLRAARGGLVCGWVAGEEGGKRGRNMEEGVG